jgi:hypothetical protein
MIDARCPHLSMRLAVWIWPGVPQCPDTACTRKISLRYSIRVRLVNRADRRHILRRLVAIPRRLPPARARTSATNSTAPNQQPGRSVGYYPFQAAQRSGNGQPQHTDLRADQSAGASAHSPRPVAYSPTWWDRHDGYASCADPVVHHSHCPSGPMQPQSPLRPSHRLDYVQHVHESASLC